MPAFLAMLLGGLINVAGTIAGRVLIGLGISVITFSGLSVTLTWVKNQAISALQGLPAEMVQLLAYAGVGEFVSIVASGLAARLLLNGLTDGSIKKWVMK
ncbi:MULTISPECIES: DUF2523 family protein [Diaphorobacter]|uniref:DUF2523 domain-containing protein n=1 Tax=Acidovorax ebreus (strain TPSY) TaxID=535289 RepID=A0A9J9UA02_ACIET|nr:MULTISPECIES: DUF2523 family protein [Diaphorobacter]ACM32321.1 conserved hypothetical protein [[Acidovorax] ebreus TPSY]